MPLKELHQRAKDREETVSEIKRDNGWTLRITLEAPFNVNMEIIKPPVS
jgi:hypothetical protein